MTDPLEIIAVLDVNAPVAEREYRHLLAQERRESRRIYLSECGAPTPQAGDGTLSRPDWAALGRAVQVLAARVQAALQEAGPRPVEFYLVARAPLPLCAQVGAALPRLLMAGAQRFVLNPRRGGTWERYPLQAEGDAAAPPFFDVIEGLDLRRPDPTQGCVAVVLSTVGGPPREDAIKALLQELGRPLARIVAIATSDTMDVTPGNAPAIAELLKRLLPKLQSCYPEASSYGFFIAGPTALAFLVGQALNLHQFRDGQLWFANFDKGRYELAIELPFQVLGQVPIPDGDADRLSRRAVLDELTDGIVELQRTLKGEDLPGWPAWGDEARRARVLAFLRDLQVAKEASGDEFALNVLQRRVTLGRGLCQALRGCSAAVQRDFGQLLLLHEIAHDSQALRTSNYYGVGRAGVVLERVDFEADVLALAVLLRWSLRRGGPRAQEQPGALASRWVSSMLAGLAAFDRAVQPERQRIERLYERRLRRYLVWHLQRARAEALRGVSDGIGVEDLLQHVDELCRGRLTVELAPLVGRLDERFDKLVDAVRDDTELFVELDGRLLRQSQNHQYPLKDVLDAVRAFDIDPQGRVARVMHTLVDAHRKEVVPWAAEGAS